MTTLINKKTFLGRFHLLGIFFRTVGNAYSCIFYSYNIYFGCILFLASFLHPFSGLCGLLALITAIFTAHFFGYNKTSIQDGTLTYNSLMTGLGLGALYAPSIYLLIVVVLISLITLLITLWVWTILAKYNLPFLSLPFLLAFWLLVPALETMKVLHYSTFEIYYLNVLFRLGGRDLVTFYYYLSNDFFPVFISAFLQTLSVIFFQNNIFIGIFIAIGLFIHSRMSFLFAVWGYAVAFGFFTLMGINTSQLLSFHVGLNFIFVAIALGTNYTIPSFSALCMTALAVMCCVIFKQGVQNILVHVHTYAYSFPFISTVYLFLWALRQRPYNRFPQLTTWQYASPEKNFYKQSNRDKRLKFLYYIPLELPFMGEWTVSQGYAGKHTHLGEWGQALDFVIVDEENKEYTNEGDFKEDYFCFNKPVLAPADGWVVAITDIVEDNEVNEVNTAENWGNSILIKHAEGLYTQMSHIKKGSFKVKEGDYVRRREILANCGSSGRSPIPHLHFQVQTTPYFGAKTLAYPLGYYIKIENGKKLLQNFAIPQESETLQSLELNTLLQNAFYIVPLQKMKYKFTKGNKVEVQEWECFTNSYNVSYLYCHTTDSYAYFVNDGAMFYFTDFEGDKNSLLFYFYLSCYKVLQGFYKDTEIKDRFPLDLFISPYVGFVNDLIAPFFNPTHADFLLQYDKIDDFYHSREIKLRSKVDLKLFQQRIQRYNFKILIKNDRLESFEIQINNQIYQAQCID